MIAISSFEFTTNEMLFDRREIFDFYVAQKMDSRWQFVGRESHYYLIRLARGDCVKAIVSSADWHNHRIDFEVA